MPGTDDRRAGAMVGLVDPNSPGNVFIPSFRNAAAVVKSDVTVFVPLTQALWVGGAGDLTVRMPDGTDVLFAAVPAGSWLKLQVQMVKSTGTAATNIVRVW